MLFTDPTNIIVHLKHSSESISHLFDRVHRAFLVSQAMAEVIAVILSLRVDCTLAVHSVTLEGNELDRPNDARDRVCTQIAHTMVELR